MMPQAGKIKNERFALLMAISNLLGKWSHTIHSSSNLTNVTKNFEEQLSDED